MIWTIVLWMAMQGQRANEPCKMSTDGPESAPLTLSIPPCRQTPSEPNARILMEPNVICKEWLPDSRSTCDAAPTQFKPLKSAEHVFEIRTKTEDHGTAKDIRSMGLGGEPHCDDPNDELETPSQCFEGTCTSMYIVPHCVRITRELWLDGKRLGIIKGLD